MKAKYTLPSSFIRSFYQVSCWISLLANNMMLVMETQQFNIFDEPIEECCSNPITGFFRDGFCHTDEMDRGLHIVCSLMTEDFLSFSKSRGNDLSTPRPEFSFPGLKAGDSWCVCAERWKEAYEHGFAPKVYLKKTNKKSTSIIDIEILKEFAIDVN